MAKTTYDPKAVYAVKKGPVTVKDQKTGLRTVLKTGEKTKLSHLQPHEIAFLVEAKGIFAPGGKS